MSQSLFHYLDSVNLAVRMMNGAKAFSKLNLALASLVIYVFCMGTGSMMLIVMGFLDLAAGTHVLQGVNHLMGGLNGHVLLAVLQLLNGLLALLFGFSILLGMLNIDINIHVNHRLSRINQYKKSTSSGRSKILRAVPKGQYGRSRRLHDVNRNNPFSCAICLEAIVEEDGVRILPNCRHYFHISCIDRWFLLSPTKSSCPLCRAIVSGIHSSQRQ